MRVDAREFKSQGLSYNGVIPLPFSFESPVEIGAGTSVFGDVSIGAHSYINGGTIRERVRIGRFCSIADRVVLGAPNHDIDLLSTHPFATKAQFDPVFGRPFRKNSKLTRETVIGHDVWIGINSIVIEGVTVNTGAVVGAGAVVTKNIPAYAICVGVPAKVIGYRFPAEIIEKLIQSKWWAHSKNFLLTLPTNNIDRCIERVMQRDEPLPIYKVINL